MHTLKRLPKAVFITVYGAVLIALVVMIAALTSYQTNARTTQTTPAPPVSAWNPAPADAPNVAASVRPNVIANAQVGATKTGVMLRGDLTPTAMVSAETAGHISRLLEQNCLDTLTLETPDNMRFELLGFCFTTLPPQTIADLLHFGDEHGANSVTVTNNLERQGGGQLAQLYWLDATHEQVEALQPAWEEFGLRPYLDRATFEAFTEDELTIMEANPSRPHTYKHEPTGAALREKWGMPEPGQSW